MTTLKDVAKESGLAVGTVSRVLNNRGYISEETRKLVYDVMERLHYRPNELARSLIRQSSNVLGVIVPHIRHPYFADLISNLEAAAAKEKLKILLLNTQDKPEKFIESLDLCASNRVEGIILCSGTLSTHNFSGTHIPVVTIERYLEDGNASVECDNEQGGRLAAAELIDCGCRSLLHISGVHEVKMPADDRSVGFATLCEKAGVKHCEVTTNEQEYNNMDYRDFLHRVLREHPDVDGIFASSDLIAAQVLQVCAQLGIAVPEKLKLVGYDDVNIARLTTPTITTVHQPLREMAAAAVALLQNAAAGEIVANRTVLPVSLVRRGSTRPNAPEETVPVSGRDKKQAPLRA